MKKRIFGMLLVAALLLSGLQANAVGIRVEEVAVINNWETESIWEERAYVDKFYISNSSAIIGTFSNSATTNSLLNVYFFIIDGTHVSIRLIEYGMFIVKNSYSSDKTYSVVMMDTYGERYSLIGTLSSGADVLSFDTEDSSTIIQALRGEGAVRFAIMEDERPTTKYIFSIEDTCVLEIDTPINSISYLDGGLIRIRRGRGESYGLMDTEGNIVARCVYYFMSDDKESGLIRVATGRTVNDFSSYIITRESRYGDYFDYGFINRSGEVIIPCEYDAAGSFSEGLAKVTKDGKCGFIDATGTLVIPCEYDAAYSFSEGLTKVKKDGKWGFIDTTGSLVIPCEYDDAESFSEGLAMVWKDGKYGYIDTTGTLVVPCEYDDVSHGEDVIITLDDEKITIYSIVEN